MKIRTAIATLTLSLASSAALAGLTQPFVVEVDLVNRIASGDTVTARYSRNDVEFIGCGIRKIEDGVGGVFTFGFCQAQNIDEEQITCFTENPELLDAISSQPDFAFITFSWDEDEVCTRIGNSNQSFYLPRKLDDNL